MNIAENSTQKKAERNQRKSIRKKKKSDKIDLDKHKSTQNCKTEVETGSVQKKLKNQRERKR